MTTDVLVPFVDNVMAQDANVATFVSSGTAGEIYAYDADTNLLAGTSELTAGAFPRAITFAIKYTDADGNVAIKKSDPVVTKGVRSIRYQAGGAGTSKVVTIDSVDNIECETEYCLKVRYESPEIAKTYGYQDMVKTYSYVTRCCGTACGCPDGATWDALMGLAEQLNGDNDSGMNNGTAKSLTHARVLNSTSPTAGNDPDEIWTLTKGSNVINCAVDIDYNSGTDVAVGDFIRIMNGGGTVTVAAGDTFRVEAVSVSNLTITLDRPWPYATQNLDTTGDAEVILKATGEAYADSTWSMEIAGAGQVNPSANPNYNYFPAYMTDFHVGLSCGLDCNGTVTTTTEIAQPEGYGVGIQKMEIDAARKSKPYMSATLTDQPVSGYDYFTGTGTTQTTAYFGQIIVDYTDTGHSSAEQPIISSKRLIIAVDAGDTSLLGTATAGAASVTTDTVLEYFARYCDVLDINFEMEQIDLDAGTD
jgi:hypothetical protein